MKPRRRALIAGAVVAAGAAGGAAWWIARRRAPVTPIPATPSDAFPNPLPVLLGDGPFGIVDANSRLTLVARPQRVAVTANAVSPRYVYEVEQGTRRVLNPTLRLRRGERFDADFWNGIDATSIVHWHGLRVDANNDGHPHYAVGPGATFAYAFRVTTRAGSYWYHPHPHGDAARQTFLGLAGMLIVEDEENDAFSRALGLKLGDNDLPLLLQDCRLDAQGRPDYRPSDAEWLHGYLGDRIAVNGTLRAHLVVDGRHYRLRVINGSGARIFRLALLRAGDPTDMLLVGNDGGLLPVAQLVREAYLAPAERIDLLLESGRFEPGERLRLVSLPFEPLIEGGHGAHAEGIPAQGAAVDLMEIVVTGRAAGSSARARLPNPLSRIAPIDTAGAPQRRFRIGKSGIGWTLDGYAYDMHAVPVTVQRDRTEIWVIENPADGMPHPMHLHGFPFQVLDRTGAPASLRALAIDPAGRLPTDLGWKDTVLVWPGETLRFAVDFANDYVGEQIYMFHCHNMQHEDRGMMINLRVR